MSEKTLVRRTEITAVFGGTDITTELRPYLLSLQYTDNEEDAADDLQIQLQDREGLWVQKWLNTAIQSAASGAAYSAKPTEESSDSSENTETTVTRYMANCTAAVRDRAGEQYYQYGSLTYGTYIDVIGWSNGWAQFTFSGKNAYVRGDCLTAITTTVGGSSTSSSTSDVDAAKERAATRGLKISAAIVRENWHGDGKDEMLDCGVFELDSVVAQGTPSTVTIKGTSLPYTASVRQVEKSRSWESYSLSGIANEIAHSNGMGCMFLSAHDPSYKRREQYRQSDIAFLSALCKDAGAGLKVTNNLIVIFDQAEYEQKKVVMTIMPGGGYTKYKLSTGTNNTYNSCRVSWVNPDGSVIEATTYAEDYKENDEKKQCLEITRKVSSIAEAQDLAAKYLRLYNKYELSGQFTFPGDTRLVAGCTVELSGWGAFDGRYIIKKATHKVSNSGYTTQIDLRCALAAAWQDDVPSGDSGESGDYAVGDLVMCNDGVHYFATGEYMLPFVPVTALYVRQISSDGTMLLLSTDSAAAVYTGWVYASDVHHV